VAYYFIYVLFAVFQRCCNSKQREYGSIEDETELIQLIEEEDRSNISLWERFKTDWYSKNIASKICFILGFPLITLLSVTVPQVEDGKWNKWHVLICALLSPLFILFVFNQINERITFPKHDISIPIFLIGLVFGLTLSILLYCFTRESAAPKWKILIALWAFTMSVLWIYLLANELVDLLQSFGRILNISEIVLGATILAWGNSLGDLVSDVVISKSGRGQMAISAAYGGPLFNLSFGLGLSLLYVTISRFPDPYVVELSHATIISGIFLLISLLSSIILFSFNQFTIPRKYSIYLIVLYALFSGFLLLQEFQIIWKDS